MLFGPDLLTKVRGDGLAALGYASNWWMIFHDVSYFESFGLPSPLAHLWTLAIEEQFYLAWPIVLLALLAVVRKRTAILATVGVAIVVLGRADGDHLQRGDPNRSYMGTDTRMGELLLGALLALALHPAGRRTVRPLGLVTAVLESRRAWPALACSAGAFAAARHVAVGHLGVRLPGRHPARRGGFGGHDPVAAGAAGRRRFAVRVDAGVVGALGRRSYSVYLWHYPVLVAFSIGAGHRSVRTSAAAWPSCWWHPAVRRDLLPLHRSARYAGSACVVRSRKITAGIRGLPHRWRRPAFVFAVSPAAARLPGARRRQHAGREGPRPEHRDDRVGAGRERHHPTDARAR